MPQDSSLQPDPNLSPRPVEPGEPMTLASESHEHSPPASPKAEEFRHTAEPMTRTSTESIAPTSGFESSGGAEDLGSRARKEVQTVGEQAKRTMHETAESAREAGTSFLSNGKVRAADELSHFSAAIRQAGQKLHEENDHQLAEYTDVIAEKIERVSGYLRQSDLGGLVSDVEQMTRRRPELVLGGMFLLGLGLSRFLKSSARRREF